MLDRIAAVQGAARPPRTPSTPASCKTGKGLEGCDCEGQGRQQWDFKGAGGLLQHPLVFLSGRLRP
jgi:hypothetical protein